MDFGSWRNNNSEVTSLMLMILINENISDLNEFENSNDEEIKAQINEIFVAMDEYVHGGLNYIKSCINEGRSQLDDEYKFYKILFNVAKLKS